MTGLETRAIFQWFDSMRGILSAYRLHHVVQNRLRGPNARFRQRAQRLVDQVQ